MPRYLYINMQVNVQAERGLLLLYRQKEREKQKRKKKEREQENEETQMLLAAFFSLFHCTNRAVMLVSLPQVFISQIQIRLFCDLNAGMTEDAA